MDPLESEQRVTVTQLLQFENTLGKDFFSIALFQDLAVRKPNLFEEAEIQPRGEN